MADPIVGADLSSPSPMYRPFKPVGITKGPGENAHEYTFVSRDDEQVLKNGEYVYYELTPNDEDSTSVGADLSSPSPMCRPSATTSSSELVSIPSRRVLGR